MPVGDSAAANGFGKDGSLRFQRGADSALHQRSSKGPPPSGPRAPQDLPRRRGLDSAGVWPGLAGH
eukprot:13811144-Alexandrium_andersonii.AAC.1